MNSNNNVLVLLSTYNGEKYLSELLDSVLTQKNVNVNILIRDDGSSDNTKKIIEDYQKRNKNIESYFKQNVGYARSFWDLLNKSKKYDYYAFCDQDDVWDKDKISVAISFLSKSHKEAMYFSKTQPVDSNLNNIYAKSTSDENHVFSLQEILLRNNAIGCTMVINKKLRDSVVNNLPVKAIMHDHWVYAVCLAIDGDVYYDLNPHIKYRQHSNNVIGKKINFKTKIKYSSFFNNKCVRSSMAKKLLDSFGNRFSEKNSDIIKTCANYNVSLSNKIKLIRQESSYTISILNRLIFIFEVLFGAF